MFHSIIVEESLEDPEVLKNYSLVVKYYNHKKGSQNMPRDICPNCGCTLENCDCTLEERGETAEEFEEKLHREPPLVREIIRRKRT